MNANDNGARPQKVTIMKRLYAVLPFIVLFVGCGPTETPPEPQKIVACMECDGDGRVYYGPDHPIVKMGFDIGEYDCPMCGGSGELENE